MCIDAQDGDLDLAFFFQAQKKIKRRRFLYGTRVRSHGIESSTFGLFLPPLNI